MATTWYFKVLEMEMGPVSHSELVDLVRDGTIAEDDWVRRETEAKWTRASDVVGLFRAARQQRQEMPVAQAAAKPPVNLAPQNELPVVQPKHSDSDNERAMRQGSQRQISAQVLTNAIVGLLIVAVAGWFIWCDYTQSVRYPAPAALKEKKPDGFHFFGWGPLSAIEYGLLWFDSVVVAYFAVSFVLRRWIFNSRT